MKRISKSDLQTLIENKLFDVWVAIADAIDADCSLDEMPFDLLGATDAEDNFIDRVEKLLDANGYISDGKRYKPQAFSSGGGFWHSARYLDENIYVFVNNEDDLELTYYDIREDIKSEGEDVIDNYGIFPCFGVVRSVRLEDMTEEDFEIWRPLAEALHKEIY